MDSTAPRLRLSSLYGDLAASLRRLAAAPDPVGKSRALVDAALSEPDARYGINTGFGILADRRIPAADLAELQRRLLLSHAAGLPPDLPKDVCRLMLALKIHALGLGSSGVSEATFQRLLLHIERDWIPVVPSKGSLGASGDLAPLAHMALPLLGEGAVWDEDGGSPVPAARVLSEAGLPPVVLAPKDGLALINGTQFMLAIGARVLHAALRLRKIADIAGAMSLEALLGSATPFDPRIHALRPHPGQIRSAANVRRLLAGSAILESHRNCGRVQDPYSLRCIPQVHGASRDCLDYAGSVVECELNSVTDNPLVFDDGAILSGGNFHGQPLALAFDAAATALAELAGISERRLFLLLEGREGLPRLLMRDTGINSGFMIPQYTAASLVSENKVLCHPASVDSIPSCLGQEDHVSMGSISATKLQTVFENAARVLSIEILAAAQALDYRAPLASGPGIEAARRRIRRTVPHREEDALFGGDFDKCRSLMDETGLLVDVEAAVGELE